MDDFLPPPPPGGEAAFRARLKDEMRRLYGARLRRVVLYGSRARGDHEPASDWDVAVVLQSPLDRAAERERLSALSYDLIMETGQDVHFMPFTEETLAVPKLLTYAITTDGVPL